MQRILRSSIVSTNWYTLVFNYPTKPTSSDNNTQGVVFYNIFLWCVVSLSSILVFFVTFVKKVCPWNTNVEYIIITPFHILG